MRPIARCSGLLVLALLTASSFVRAQEVDAQTLYELTTDGTTAHVKPGGTGRLVIAIQPKAGAHVSEEAPLKLVLSSSPGLKLARETLSRKDAPGPSPRFAVPFDAAAQGKGALRAHLTFFICTEKLCLRQERKLELPVDVSGA